MGAKPKGKTKRKPSKKRAAKKELPFACLAIGDIQAGGETAVCDGPVSWEVSTGTKVQVRTYIPNIVQKAMCDD